ncbi:hypothetical protein JTE90_001426, partial [Oedothorax gibbosus]
SYQGNFGTSPWSTLGRNKADDSGPFAAAKGLGPQQRTGPQNNGPFQGSLTSLRGEQHFPQGLGRRISQNGVIPGGFPFPFFLKSSPSGGGEIHYAAGLATLQDPAPQQEGVGEDIELDNLFTHRTSLTDQTGSGGGPTAEENQNVRVCANEYSNNFFIAEYNAGRAQTTLRNKSSRPQSSYSNDGTGTVPSRNNPAKQKRKEGETNETTTPN